MVFLIFIRNCFMILSFFRINPVTKKLEPYLPPAQKVYRIVVAYTFVLFMVSYKCQHEGQQKQLYSNLIIYQIQAKHPTYIAALRGSSECHCSDAVSSGDVDGVLQSIWFNRFNSGSATKLIRELDGNNYSHKYQFDMHHSFESGIMNRLQKFEVSRRIYFYKYFISVFSFQIYKYVAEWLTNLECPRTFTDYEDSYTSKVFLFQFINFYSSLIYIAFFKVSNPPNLNNASTMQQFYNSI